jgi:hypothetical protein
MPEEQQEPKRIVVDYPMDKYLRLKKALLDDGDKSMTDWFFEMADKYLKERRKRS